MNRFELVASRTRSRPGAPRSTRSSYLTSTVRDAQSRLRTVDVAIASNGRSLRARAGAGAGSDELEAIHARLLAGLERAERLVADRSSGANLLMQSFVLLLREASRPS